MVNKGLSAFIENANKVHSSFYDYTKSVYITAKIKLTITCPIHGDFEQQPSNHISGQGCPKCGREKSDKNRKVWTEESFREKVSELHPSLVFDKTVYTNPKEKVLYECLIHGEKSTYPYNLLKGCGCKQCASSKPKIGKEEWLSRFKDCGCETIIYHNIPNEFKAEEKITFICNIHGEFEQTPKDHLKSCCTQCGREKSNEHHRKNPTGWDSTSWQKCAEKSKNFDSFKVYIIKCWNEKEVFYKIGKTFKTVAKRFSYNAIPYNYEIIDIFVFESAKEASIFEKYLQKENKRYKYYPQNKFDGFFECFTSVIKVDAKYSSQECNNCGHISKDNRSKQEMFKCVQCGHSGNADYEASLTILKRGQTLLHANVEQ